MAADWFAALTILSAESAILRQISIDEITDSFGHCSRRLREQVLLLGCHNAIVQVTVLGLTAVNVMML